ncbi:MAG TPA: outer membrane beta-barrel protein [Beijerinckiaceae bacterium]|nr:outer membrane beta-barrel protein [Beijerinckiaceae bacterium]
MGSLKTLAYAGAVAMVASSALFAAPASAADLGAPPIMAPPPPPPMVDGMSGLYLRGDIGVGVMSSASMKSTLGPTIVAPNYMVDKYSFDNVAFAGVGVGYQFNSFLRFDVTGEYRTTSKFSAFDSFNGTSFGMPCIKCYNLYSSSIDSSNLMANAYIDLGTWSGLTPYVGAGIGFAHHKVSGLQDVGVAATIGGFGYAADTSQTNFAWALMAGVGMQVTRNLTMDLGYRYMNMGSVDTNAIHCVLGNGLPNPNWCSRHTYDVNSHDVKIGFRYMFGGDVAPAPAAPLIRKF